MENWQVVRVMVYFIEYRGSIYNFIGCTAPQAFGAFRNVFLDTMEGFGEIQDRRILSKEPVRLGLEHVSRFARFRDLIPRALPADMKPEDVAILNQAALNDEIGAGRILKFLRSR